MPYYIWYNHIVATSDLAGKEVIAVEVLLTLMVSVLASVLAHVICKWLDGD